MPGRVYVATVDGSPSASSSDTGSVERTTSSRLSDAERELNDLRARAYGPSPDIEADPAAVARLIELEAAHVGAATPVTATEAVGSRAADTSPTATSARRGVAADLTAPEAEPMIPRTSRERFGRPLWQRATATRSLALLIAGSITVVAVLVYAATWLLARPDATLQPTEVEPDSVIFVALNGNVEVRDVSTLRQFEQYHASTCGPSRTARVRPASSPGTSGAPADFNFSASLRGWNSRST